MCNLIEEKREDLHRAIDKFGLNSVQTAIAREELEIIELKEQIKMNGLNKNE